MLKISAHIYNAMKDARTHTNTRTLSGPMARDAVTTAHTTTHTHPIDMTRLRPSKQRRRSSPALR